mmetsp:Transcript_39973/g.29477  ORF Transcript_39973/g.29477 Transcript_39973/m.29477 type:complete len:100 (+) Transcript_39973:725-1024(+)
MDELGVSAAFVKAATGTKAFGSYVYTKTAEAGSAVNRKIDENDTLHSAKASTKETMGSISKGIAGYWSSLTSKISKKENKDGNEGDSIEQEDPQKVSEV